MSVTATELNASPSVLERLKLSNVKEQIFPAWELWALTISIILLDAVLIVSNARISFTFAEYLDLLPYWFAVPILFFFSALFDQTRLNFFVKIIRIVLLLFYMIPTLMAVGILNHVVMTIPLPFADDILTAMDQSLGLNWLAYAKLIAAYPSINSIMFQIYNGLMPTIMLVAVEAIIVGEYQRCKEFISLIVTSLVITIFAATFLPATGAMDRFADANLKSLFHEGAGNYFVQQLLEVRGTAPLLINPSHLAGLASVPSFHTIASILLIYGSRGHVLRTPVITAIALIILAGTPVYGGHYFVDMIAGAIVALAFIFVGRRINTFQD
jgi:PAP2 superfamily